MSVRVNDRHLSDIEYENTFSIFNNKKVFQEQSECKTGEQGGETMTYYKVIKDNEFIGVGTSYELRKYQTKHGILLVADDDTAQYIDIDGILYRDSWFKVVTTDTIQYENADIVVISEEEYQQLFEAIDKGEEIEINTDDEPSENEEVVVIDNNEEVTLDYLKAQKVKEMSYICNQIIVNGFDITLSDGEVHHFSLTVQDQLNLITLSAMISAGEQTIPYHADGELCRNFSAADIGLVIKTSTELKVYHTTYYNSLKLYIQSLDDREAIADVYYGMSIPEEYESDVLKAFISNQNSVGEMQNETYE